MATAKPQTYVNSIFKAQIKIRHLQVLIAIGVLSGKYRIWGTKISHQLHNMGHLENSELGELLHASECILLLNLLIFQRHLEAHEVPPEIFLPPKQSVKRLAEQLLTFVPIFQVKS